MRRSTAFSTGWATQAQRRSDLIDWFENDDSIANEIGDRFR